MVHGTGPQSLHPSDCVLVRRKKRNRAGENEWAELSQASRMGPHIMGPPKKDNDYMGMGGIARTGSLAHTRPQTFPGFQKGPGAEGSPITVQ